MTFVDIASFGQTGRCDSIVTGKQLENVQKGSQSADFALITGAVE